jgi:KUP system potassium uptake protein
VLLLTFTFRSSTRLATAYGVAVTGTFLITTTLFLCVARARWKWRAWRVAVFGTVFSVIELTYFAANLTKVAHGGWLTLLIALAVFTTMLTWQRGREIVTEQRVKREGPLLDFIADLHAQKVQRVPGTAVFAHPNKETTPLALRANWQFNHVLHQRVVIISGHTANVPHIPWDERLSVDSLGDPTDGIVHIDANFGFQDKTDFPEVLHRASLLGRPELPEDIDLDQVSYFVSRISLSRTDTAGMAGWRKRLFVGLAHNAASQAEYLCLPYDRTVVMGSQVDV